jgi:hypothetical protein
MNVATLCAEPPAASEAETAPSSPVSVGTASGGTGNQAGSVSQIRPQSVSLWVAADPPAGGAVALEPPGTGVRSGEDAAGGADPAGAVGGGVAVAVPHATTSRLHSSAAEGTASVRRGVTASS